MHVVGARPQFIKVGPVSLALRKAGVQESIIHTGQHYDYGMSQIFFKQIGIPEPDINLEAGSGSHGYQTGQMLIRLEKVLLTDRPDCVVVYGDTNSTLAGALAASKLHIPIAHVEAGLRSYNRRMPEEINRVATDALSDVLFTPTQQASANLAREGVSRDKVHLVGDVMFDACRLYAPKKDEETAILQALGLSSGCFILATIHRAENTDDALRLTGIIRGLDRVAHRIPVVLPAHPRTKMALTKLELIPMHLRLIPPISYQDMIALEKNASRIITDSGGVQKEAYFYGVPCLTVRTETEWEETVRAGWNVLVGPEEDQIEQTLESFQPPPDRPPLYGDGKSASRIASILSSLA